MQDRPDALVGSRPINGSPVVVFIAGKSDWGVHQRTEAFETMQKAACTRMVGVHLVDGAGRWVQQEQPNEVNKLLQPFLQQTVRR